MEEFYLMAFMNVKLIINEKGELMMEGYIEILDEGKYNWKSYYFKKKDQYKNDDHSLLNKPLQSIKQRISRCE